ncbi:MAG: CehA/McbA family metallohydrolase [Candidatus Bathyarchaeota archaeon]|nr:CehA/McbA family metallohydrolase [Candidatus Bathyarchaeota archaeon A05DMB-3]MDH7607549.1 CehA/McbA family metallohydrolase [Candidatus Bathyarchaeota archaeon]
MKVHVDLHVHTCYSYDGLIKPEELVFHAKKAGLNGVAITDHDRIDGALKMAKETKDFLIIPGIEISSLDGHIIGLNLQEPVSKKLSMEETVDKIHELGGLAVACHPQALLKVSLGRKISKKFDAVEVINASAFPFKRSVKKAHEIASTLKMSQVAGSDAHYAPEIGSAYTIVNIEAELDCDEIFKAIKQGLCQPFGNAIPLKIRLKREILALKRRF